MFDPRSDDYYARLGVAEDADQDEIRRAYRALVKDLHPDHRGGATAAYFDGVMQGVNEAYATLKDPGKRARYDLDRRDAQDRGRASDEEAARRSKAEARAEAAEEARRRAEEEEAAWREWERAEEERRRREEEEARRQEEEWFWTDEEDEEPSHWEPPDESRPAATGAGSFLHKLPGPVHRAMIYTSGSWLWLGTAVVLWHLPFFGAELVAVLIALAVPVAAGVVLFKTAFALPFVERVVGFLMPGEAAFSVVWYARRIVEAAALAPVFLILASFVPWLWGLLSLCAIAYVCLWGVEFVHWRQGRRETGG